MPTALATALDAPDSPDLRQKQRRISARIRRACAALISGEARTITEAAAIAKIRREAFSIALHKPHVIAHIKANTCRALAIAAGRAGAVKVELLESNSDHVRNDASTYLLALAGIRPATDPQVSVNIDLKAGYVIDLTGAGQPGSGAGSAAQSRFAAAFQQQSADDASG